MADAAGNTHAVHGSKPHWDGDPIRYVPMKYPNTDVGESSTGLPSYDTARLIHAATDCNPMTTAN